MVHAERSPDGVVVEAGAYRLAVPGRPEDRPWARLEDAAGVPWAELALGWAVDATVGRDTTGGLGLPEVSAAGPEGSAADEGSAAAAGGAATKGPAAAVGEITLAIPLLGSAWDAKRLVIVCAEDHLRMRVEVDGTGDLDEVALLGGHLSIAGRRGTGFVPSGRRFRALWSPEPTWAERVVLGADENASLDVGGTSAPGGRHWFATPPPWCYAVALAAPAEGSTVDPGTADSLHWLRDRRLRDAAALEGASDALPPGPWLGVGLAPRPGEQQFTAFRWHGGEGSFSLSLAYDGRTRVRGTFASPDLVLLPGQPDPYAAIAAHRALLERLGRLPAREPVARPAWWTRPMFCGWGAQSAIAERDARAALERDGAAAVPRPEAYATAAAYDAFLATLDAHGLRPPTITVDDRWQRAYGSLEADPAKWPDLGAWIARRHREGTRVLLWWKAWDPEALPASWCVRNRLGDAVAADPSNPAYEAHLRAEMRRALGVDGYDADGLKIDFTAWTPAGPGLVAAGTAWGAELLHRLLALVYRAAKDAKPDALVVAHAPNAMFRDVADMVRLNDVNMSRPVVAQMRHRARVARAACPELRIDSDDWPMADLAQWREYLAVQSELGVPALYYADLLESGETLTDDDYAAVARQWAAWERSAGSGGS